MWIFSATASCAPLVQGARRCRGFVLRSLAVAVTVLVLVDAVRAQAGPPAAPLSLQEAMACATRRSAALRSHEATIRSLRESETVAASLPDPVLRLSLDNWPVEGPMRFSFTGDFMTMRSLSVMQTYVRPEKRQALGSRFAREADVARARRLEQRVRLQVQTAQAWFDTYFQMQQLALLKQLRDETALAMQAAESAYRGGQTGQADVHAARAAIARIDIRLEQGRTDLANARAELTRWVGDAADRPLASPPGFDRLHRLSGSVAQQIERHPGVEIRRARERVAQAAVRIANLERQADWSWTLMYSMRGGRYGDMVSAGISLPLQWNRRDRQDRELAARSEEAAMAHAELEESRRAYLLEVQRLQASWHSGLARIVTYTGSLIPLAADRTRAMEAAYRGGKSSLSEVLEARRLEIETKLERLSLERQTASLWSELEFLFPESGPSGTASTETALTETALTDLASHGAAASETALADVAATPATPGLPNPVKSTEQSQ